MGKKQMFENLVTSTAMVVLHYEDGYDKVSLKDLIHLYCGGKEPQHYYDKVKKVDLSVLDMHHTEGRDESVYVINGYDNREHYLECLAEDNDVPLHYVWELANQLGPEEDFDGLRNAVEDIDGFLGISERANGGK